MLNALAQRGELWFPSCKMVWTLTQGSSWVLGILDSFRFPSPSCPRRFTLSPSLPPDFSRRLQSHYAPPGCFFLTQQSSFRLDIAQPLENVTVCTHVYIPLAQRYGYLSTRAFFSGVRLFWRQFVFEGVLAWIELLWKREPPYLRHPRKTLH